MAILAVVLLIVGWQKGGGQHVAGLKSALGMTWQVLPLLVCAFIVAGMVQSLISPAALSKWIGQESGWRGIILGTIAGGLTPGGPYVNLPIVAVLLKSGASVGTLVAYVTGWSLWAVGRLPMEIGILGWRFTLVRLACTFFFPPVAGFLAQLAFGRFKL
jgi:uncharacterized membrane protein YraQ (UPF0718 family)